MQKMTYENFPEKIIQNIYFSLFKSLNFEEAHSRYTGSNKHPLTEAYNNLLQLAIVNKKYHASFNDSEFIMSLIREIVSHYGLVFTDGQENNMFSGILNTEVRHLKNLLAILAVYDPRKIYNTNHLTYINSLINKTTDQIGTSNPILNFLNVTSSIRIKKITSELGHLLDKASEKSLLNSKLVRTALGVFIDTGGENWYLDKQFLSNVNPDHSVYYYTQFQSLMKNLNIQAPELDILSESFCKIYTRNFSWLMALGTDYKGTQKLINMLQQRIIPLSLNKIMSLIQASNPEFFLNDILVKEPNILSSLSKRMLKLFISPYGQIFYQNSLNQKDIYVTLRIDKQVKRLNPENVITVFRKMPALLKNNTVVSLFDYPVTLELLSHPSVDLKKWKIEDLYNALIKSRQVISNEALIKLAKLPYTLTLYNKIPNLQTFLTTAEFNLLSESPNGNFVLSQLKERIYQANLISVLIQTRDKSSDAFVSQHYSLLKLLCNIPQALSAWLIAKYPDVTLMQSELSNNKTLMKFLSIKNIDQLLQYNKDIDFLISLDKLPQNPNTTALDFLLFLIHNNFFDKITRHFPTSISLRNAYYSGLLLNVFNNLNLLKLNPDLLKVLQKHVVLNSSTIYESVLSILANANHILIDWMINADSQLIIESAEQHVLEVLETCPHLPQINITDINILFKSLAVLHAAEFDSSCSILEFILKPVMSHALVTILNFLMLESNDKSIILKIDFLKAIAQGDISHPLFLYPIDDWYELFLCQDKLNITTQDHQDLFTYLTNPCNTLYWEIIIKTFSTIAEICSKPANVVQLIETHPSKNSYFGDKFSSKETSSPSAEPSTPQAKQIVKKRTLQSTQPIIKRHKYINTEYVEPDGKGTNKYNQLTSVVNTLSRYRSSISRNDQINELKKMEFHVQKMIINLSPEEDKEKTPDSFTI